MNTDRSGKYWGCCDMPKGHYVRRPRPPGSMKARQLRPLFERFERHYIPEPNSGCFLWTGAVQRGGYGVIGKDKPSKGNIAAHHASWELHCGPIPEGMCVLHRCDNPPCVNPEHLFLGTRKDNNADCDAKGRRPRGTSHHHAKLTDQQVREIRAAKQMTGLALAAIYKVDRATIDYVRRGDTWKHVQ